MQVGVLFGSDAFQAAQIFFGTGIVFAMYILYVAIESKL